MRVSLFPIGISVTQTTQQQAKAFHHRWIRPCTFAACSDDLFLEPVEVRGITLHVVEDGEIVRETDYIAYPRNLLLTLP